MSSIAGVYLLDGSPVDPDRLKRMNDRLSHRGPDGSGLWCEGSVGLGHQMLWTTPESLHEKLPLEADGLVITADARVDNREELLPELGLREEVSDSEVILETYRKWGRDCVDRLLGDFAFVIWDKAKGELFCARDHMGVKPFYYYHEPGKIFAFATEIKALFAWGVQKEINEVRIGDYLENLFEDREITFYLGILRLPAANFMVVNTSDLQKSLYWALDPKREIELGSDEEYEKAFREIFEKAVRCRLRSAFPVGSMLSGGLDSSSIVCMAREILPKDRFLKTFSVVFNTVTQCDERQYIESVLEKGGFQSYYIQGDMIGPLSDVEEALWHMDQPFSAPNLFLHWAMYKEARNQDSRILLDGIDGDNVVSHGIANITELVVRGRFFSMLYEVRCISRLVGISPRKLLLRYALRPFVPNAVVELWHNFQGGGEPNLANFEFAKRICFIDRAKKQYRLRYKPSKTARLDQWLNLTWAIHQQMLEEANIAASAFSVEPRNPFYDIRIMEFCLALPSNQKLRNGITRRIMHMALRDILPELIYHRIKKTSLSPNFLHGILGHNKKVIEDLMINGGFCLNNYIDCPCLSESYRKLKHSNELLATDSHNIWLAAVLATWLRLEF